jgi:NAD-dependent SIR2 family protein deacetylase
MPGHTVLVTGAGFSRPAGGPLLKDLLSEDCLERSAADRDVLDMLVQLIQRRQHSVSETTLSLEEFFTEIWREARTGGSFMVEGVSLPAQSLLSTITIHLASVCGGIRIRRAGQLWTTYTTFLRQLFQQSRTLTIITFNYDLLLEQLLDDIGLRYEYGAGGAIEFDDATRRRRLRRSGSQLDVYKLHGSASWGVCRGCGKAEKSNDQVTSFETPYVPIRRKSCPRCGERFLESGIVPPILEKAGESRYREPIWVSARKALRRAREVISIGYSLPESDHEALSLFREIESPFKRPRITVVCGTGGAPIAYSKVFARFTDAKMYFEEFATQWTS